MLAYQSNVCNCDHYSDKKEGAILLAGGVIRMERGKGPSYYVKQGPATESM